MLIREHAAVYCYRPPTCATFSRISRGSKRAAQLAKPRAGAAKVEGKRLGDKTAMTVGPTWSHVHLPHLKVCRRCWVASLGEPSCSR
jgi:hypothetical protein